MPAPDIDELDLAYETGRSATPEAKNPYYFGTALWMQWNFGQRDAAMFSTNFSNDKRLTKVGRLVLFAAVVTIACALGRYALL